MSNCSTLVASPQQAAAMRLKQPVPRAALRLAHNLPVSLSEEARRRLKWMDWHKAHGQNVSQTCRHFTISRSTFYRWKKRYDREHLSSLENRSCRPKRIRKPTWTPETVAAVKRLREQYPRWGKDKLAVLLSREGLRVSVSMVGRILRHLKRRGQLIEPLGKRVRGSKKKRARIYAVRKPRGYMAEKAGDLVQIDTQDVYPWPGLHLKHFTATDVVCRVSIPCLHSSATARVAADVLKEVVERSPYQIKNLQIDGGGEYMAEFEEACRAMGIGLFVLPPRSPKLNGCVERSHRTHQEEFYEVTDAEPTLEALRQALREWEHVYNTIRPHQALGYKTPLEFLLETNQYQPRKEGCIGGTERVGSPSTSVKIEPQSPRLR